VVARLKIKRKKYNQSKAKTKKMKSQISALLSSSKGRFQNTQGALEKKLKRWQNLQKTKSFWMK